MTPTTIRLLVLVATALAPVLAASGAGSPVMQGFAAGSAANEAALESRFDARLSAKDMRGWLERLSAAPNHVGSPHDKANAEFMLEQFRAWGWEANIETFYVLYPTPRRELLELVGPRHYRATLSEPPVAGDRSSQRPAGALPPYNVYGADGDVTGEVVYVNYGMPDDYKDLARRGVSVKGRIVIARYGNGWRGLKPKLAYEHGAIGCIIYSDPKDDGYGAADTYPAGAGRPAHGVQRGSVADLPIYSGDPLTPGVGATRDAPRLKREEAKTLLKIPVLPISYADAQPFLESLAGPLAPPRWRGGLPLSYHLGPGPARVHLLIESDWSQRPIYDVVAKLTGSEYPDEWVLRGNHHDGWVFGADDPLSGNVVLMAELKAIGELAAGGWRPKRTLVYFSWDGEEPGLLGSTEWVETHADELAQHAVAYVNSDNTSHGFLSAGGSHSLQRLVDEVAGGVSDPAMQASVLARARARAIIAGTAKDGGEGRGEERSEERKRIAQRLLKGGELPLTPLGSGSDYTPFLQHAGIASLDLRFGNDEPSGDYHSLYDSFDHYIRIEDPELAYGVALAEVAGHTMLRLADADLLPLRAQDFAAAVTQYVEEIDKLADRMRTETAETDQLIAERIYELGADSSDRVGPPAHEAAVPYLNLAPLKNAASALATSAAELDSRYATALAEPSRLTRERMVAVNGELRRAEQALLSPGGLPGRGWYRHMVYAPGLHTGYGAKTLPAVREAVEERRWAEAADYVLITAKALDAYRAALDAAADKLL
ncbi:MAG TPA: transferrin receptor-like dimerization domain-containing protein [Steroidobacteraceae bacterium]|nr:transferrin receptor-like dimerization domain-containing protein [Steroidobacteraceae bacterium]